MLSEKRSEIPVIDLHSDYLSCKLGSNRCVTSPERVLNSSVAVQFFAIFLSPDRMTKKFLMKELEEFSNLIKHHGFVHGKTPEKIINAFEENKKVAVSAIEDASILELAGRKDWAVSFGVRYITITQNTHNIYGDSATDRASGNGGLTRKGRELLRWMEGRRILPDVSHVSEETFKDVLSVTKGPVIASHSCVYTLNPHPRNLKDYQIKEIAGTGGVIGINFCPLFLSGESTCSIDRVVEHIQYVSDIAGVDFVAIGSDFDGISRGPDGLNGPEDFPCLQMALEKKGFTEEEIKKVFYNNLHRLLGTL